MVARIPRLSPFPPAATPRARLRRAAEIAIAQTRAADTKFLRSPALDADLSGSSADVPALRRLLLAWWELHGRHAIPWKLRPDGSRPADGEVIDPYGVFVAELMLQQTQLAVVLPYWQRWMAVLPSLEALAAADDHDVLLLWQGLGYYARARRLLQASRHLMAVTPSAGAVAWPADLEGWLALPGIGRSTAGSILSSAFDLSLIHI